MKTRDDRQLIDRFRVALVASAKSLGVVSFEMPFRDFLAEDRYSHITCPYTLAAEAIIYFCVEDGKYNETKVAILAAFSFLTGLRKCDPPSAIIGKDLIRILKTSPTVEEVTKWAKTAFP